MHSFLKSGFVSENKDKGSNSSAKTIKTRTVPWVEKYRPRTITDVVEQNEPVAVLKECIQGADLPNFLFYGPPGTGKTSTILAAARQLFGDMYKDRILELNASDERGIQVVREKVKNFAQLSASNVRPDGKPCPPFKIVIFDEADSMTNAAQDALRRTMEKCSKSTRFCLICNYVSRIIEPLTSRCNKFQFRPLHQNKIFERLKFICEKEEVSCTDEVLNGLVTTSGGDMRRAITCLQSCCRLKGKNEEININDVYEVTGVVPEKWILDFVNVCKSNNHTQLQKFLQDFILEAYPATQVLEQFNTFLIKTNTLTDDQKSIIGEKIALVSHHLHEGGSEYLQLLDLGCTALKVFCQ